MKFKSEVDYWYYGLIVLIATLISIGIFPSVKYTGLVGVTFLALFILMGVGFLVWLLLSTHYTITDDLLIIQSGPLYWEILRKDIHSINPSRSISSSPALSLNRLEIKYGKCNSILVSPKERDQFIKKLAVNS